MVLTLFKIASGPAESGVSYKELSKINVQDLSSPFVWQLSGRLKISTFKQWYKNSAFLSQDLALSLTKMSSAFLEKNEASDFSNLSAKHLSQQSE